MKLLRFRCFFVVVLLLAFWSALRAVSAGHHSGKYGTLVVLVRLGDINSSPATNVYVEAYGFVREYGSKKSFVLETSQPGRYETSLPAGVYDVFVSEGVSIPQCKRVRITADGVTSWSANLDLDEVYTEK